MERDLKRFERPIANSDDDEEDDVSDLPVGGLKSAVVPVKHPSPTPPSSALSEQKSYFSLTC